LLKTYIRALAHFWLSATHVPNSVVIYLTE
jgi:hypothetical protein